jgi:hypothetical protein
VKSIHGNQQLFAGAAYASHPARQLAYYDARQPFTGLCQSRFGCLTSSTGRAAEIAAAHLKKHAVEHAARWAKDKPCEGKCTCPYRSKKEQKGDGKAASASSSARGSSGEQCAREWLCLSANSIVAVCTGAGSAADDVDADMLAVASIGRKRRRGEFEAAHEPDAAPLLLASSDGLGLGGAGSAAGCAGSGRGSGSGSGSQGSDSGSGSSGGAGDARRGGDSDGAERAAKRARKEEGKDGTS